VREGEILPSAGAKERYRCLGKGFQPEVMVIPAIPFQMWLKFRRNQQGLIGVMTLQAPVTILPVLPSAPYADARDVSQPRMATDRVENHRQTSPIPSTTYRFGTAAVYIYL